MGDSVDEERRAAKRVVCVSRYSEVRPRRGRGGYQCCNEEDGAWPLGFDAESGVTREAIREFGGWKSSGVTGRVCDRPRSEGVVPETRAAARATDRMEMGRFLRGLSCDPAPVEEDEVGYSTRVVGLPAFPGCQIPRRRIRCNLCA